jgi:hypothetical protein
MEKKIRIVVDIYNNISMLIEKYESDRLTSLKKYTYCSKKNMIETCTFVALVVKILT